MTSNPDELPDFTDYCWPTDTTCVDGWDNDDESVGIVYTEREKAYAVSLAGQSLRVLTLYRVGGCPVIVRPSTKRCRAQTWQTYPVSGVGSVGWQPVNIGGSWLNIGCGHAGGCGCAGLSEVALYGAASDVLEVKIDGATLDPSAYRLDAGARLVRTDGDVWPLCQNLALDDTEPNTWSVTYTPGARVDGVGARAAGRLAGEFIKACTTGQCELPDNIVSIARNGISMNIGIGAFPDGRTGIREVDAYVDRWNPNGLKSPPAVWSPETRRPRRVASTVISGGGAGPGFTIIDGGDADTSN